MELPLASIISRLPEALREKVRRSPSAREMVLIPLAPVLAQLRHGAVRVSFGELKATAPAGTFRDGPELDATPVEMPLNEILPRLKPCSFARRPEQKQVQGPTTIPPIFSSAQARAEQGASAKSAPKPQTVVHLDDHQASRLMAETSSAAAPAPAPIAPNPSPRRSAAAEAPAPVVPVQAAAPPVNATAEAGLVKLSLAALARNWPEPMRHEILEVHLAASVHIPFSELEGVLARGRANFKWAQIRRWLVPAGSNTSHVHDDVSFELPLSTLIPPFLAHRSVRTAPVKVNGAIEIPDIFLSRSRKEDIGRNGAALAEFIEVPLSVASSEQGKGEGLPAKVAPAPIVTPAPVPAAKPAPAIPASAPANAAKPVPAPKDIIQRACRLNGVEGAFVATLDGLIIAAQLPPTIQADTAAAFLPQVYNRLAQYARDLKMGAPAEISVMLDKTPLEIHRTSSAYFAVIGKPSEPLPKPQLTVLAGLLSA